MMPTVSVIMPAYNVAPYIGQAIASVCAQTFRDVELIIVDDGSTDDTAAIAEAWAARDSRVRVLRQPNGGIAVARNHALRMATGSVMALLDSDDMWDPAYVASAMAIFDAQPEVDVVTGNAYFLGSRLDGHPARPWPDHRPTPDLANILSDEESVFIMSMFRRRVYETIGGFDPALRTNEDYHYWLRAAAAGFQFARMDQPLGRYRRRDDSLSAGELRMLTGILTVYRKVRPLIEDRPAELAILDRQVARFEAERLASAARQALETGDYHAVSANLAALHAQRGGAALAVARLMARWTPSLLAKAYHFRRARREAAA